MERDRAHDRVGSGILIQTPAGAAFFKRANETEADLELIVVEPEMVEHGLVTEAVIALMRRNVDSYRESIRGLALLLAEHVPTKGGSATIDRWRAIRLDR